MARYRLYTNKSPVLTCNQKNDAFTVSDITNGNGALTYPVGLVTADEVEMAGTNWDSSNSSFYLYTGQQYWTMSPFNFLGTMGTLAYDFFVQSNGRINISVVNNTLGVRPVFSLKSDVTLSGSGTQSDPWVVQN